jgi:hypothetical protein
MTQTASNPLEALESEFGSTLHLLDPSEKLHLIGILAMREQQIEDGESPDEYPVTTAYADHPFQGSGNVFHSVEILEWLPSRETRALILALANQIHQP